MDYETICKKFGNNLRHQRRIKDLTQEQLAEKLDISDYHYISTIESGKSNITFKTLFKLSQALETEIYNLFKFD